MARKTETVTESKRPRVITTVVDDNGQMTFTVLNAGSFTFNPFAESVSDDNRREATIHGFRQKISDAAALGADATPEEKLAAMQAVADHLSDGGDWNRRGTGDGTGAVSGLIFRAFYQFAVERAETAKKPTPTRDDVRKLYDSKSRSEQLAFRNIPRIAEIMDELRAKSTSVDVDGLFGELDNL